MDNEEVMYAVRVGETSWLDHRCEHVSWHKRALISKDMALSLLYLNRTKVKPMDGMPQGVLVRITQRKRK